MSKTQIISHNGKSIYFMDFSGLREEPLIESVIIESKEFIRSQPLKSVITLTNVENMHFNYNIKDMFYEFLKGNKEHVKASAVVGISGLLQIMFNGAMKLTGREVKSFDNINVAKDWLVSRN
jgi:hypothetical protein